MSAVLHPSALERARFVFHAFIIVADAEDSLGPREVERFHELASSPPADTPASLREALHSLQDNYADLWKEYQAGEFSKSPGALASQWALMHTRLSGEGPEMAASLVRLLDEVVKAGSPMLARLGLASSAKSKVLEEIRAALDAPSGSGVSHQPAAPAAPSIVQPHEADAATLWPASTLHLGRTDMWQRGKTRLRCIAVVPETHDVKSFFFAAEPARLFAYEPGQFMTLELPIEGKTVRRSYTISSSPTRPWTVSITVKRVPQGHGSNWLHDNLKAGDALNVYGPNGDFTCLRSPAPKLLFIAAGSGITPLMSMLRWLSDTHSPVDAAFLDFVRSTDDVIYRQELAHIAMRMGGRLKLVIVPGEVRPGQPWHGPTGFVSEGMIRQFVPDFVEREVFTCGPGKFMQLTRDLLAKAGHPQTRYHEESFGAAPAAAPMAEPAKATAAPPPPTVTVAVTSVTSPAAAAGKSKDKVAAQPSSVPKASAAAEIVFARTGKTVTCTADDMILEVAEANGIALEHSCRAGSCGTCRTFKKEGEVELDEQTALTADDVAAGYVLVCVGRARGRVVLDA